MISKKENLLLGAKWLGVALVCAGMASCASTSNTTVAKKNKPKSKEYFSESEYGVKASPRVVADGQPVPKGGGRYMVGDPYEVKGKVYVPKEDPNYNKTGLASWYGSAFHGRYTANGEIYDSSYLSAAHPTFPLPSYARVTNLDTGSSVIVRVNDRGPFHPGRIIDVSDKTAELLDFKRTGTARVNVQYVGKADLSGHDMPYLMASYVRKGSRLPGIFPDSQIGGGVMVASNQPLGDQLQSFERSTQPVQAKNEKLNGRGFKSELQLPPVQAARVAAAPMPSNRPADLQPTYAAQPQMNVAAARPQQRQIAAEAPTQKPVRVASTHQSRPAVAPKAPVQPAQMRPTMAPVTTSETAYAAPTKRRGTEPQVIFGNVILRDDGMMQQVDVSKSSRR